MRIDRVELYHVAMPLLEPWRTAYGEDAEIHSVLCRMTSGDRTGWGEATPFAAPCYSPECAGGAFLVARDWLAPQVVEQDVESGDDLQRRLSLFKGNPFAKAALDTAWWSLHAAIEDRPLHELLGATRDEVAVGADFGVIDSLDTLLERVGDAVERGFPRVKLKFRPGWDLPVVQAVRERFPELVMHVDCNGGYTLDDLDTFRALDEFDLAMIEQPLAHDDLHDHARLQQEIRTPVCLDESITGIRAARQALALGSCRVVNVKPGRVGGLTVALAIEKRCRDAGVPAWVGGMLESAVGASHCASLAMLDGFTYPGDVFPSSKFYAEDLADPPIELSALADGTPSVRAVPRTPVPHPERLAERTLQRATIEA